MVPCLPPLSGRHGIDRCNLDDYLACVEMSFSMPASARPILWGKYITVIGKGCPRLLNTIHFSLKSTKGKGGLRIKTLLGVSTNSYVVKFHLDHMNNLTTGSIEVEGHGPV